MMIFIFERQDVKFALRLAFQVIQMQEKKINFTHFSKIFQLTVPTSFDNLMTAQPPSPIWRSVHSRLVFKKVFSSIHWSDFYLTA